MLAWMKMGGTGKRRRVSSTSSPESLQPLRVAKVALLLGFAFAGQPRQISPHRAAFWRELLSLRVSY
jgi:hypothetical protein